MDETRRADDHAVNVDALIASNQGLQEASLRAGVAIAVAAKALDAQRQAGAAIVALIDPAVGRSFDRRA